MNEDIRPFVSVGEAGNLVLEKLKMEDLVQTPSSQAETSNGHQDIELAAFDRLTGEFKHFCPDWDYMAIDETCPEADGCSCNFNRAP